MPLGQSFAPLGDPMDRQQGPSGNGPVNPVQEAIKMLSLKIPRTAGAGGGLAPTALLGATGMGGAPQGRPMGAPPMAPGGAPGPQQDTGTGNPLLDELMKMLRGLGAPAAGMSAPAPHITPGVDGAPAGGLDGGPTGPTSPDPEGLDELLGRLGGRNTGTSGFMPGGQPMPAMEPEPFSPRQRPMGRNSTL